MHRPSWSRGLVPFLAAAALWCLPARLQAQIQFPSDDVKPQAGISPLTHTRTSDTVWVTATWTDETKLDTASATLTLSNAAGTQVLARTLTVTSSARTEAQAVLLVHLAPGANTLTAQVSDNFGNLSDPYTVTYTYNYVPPPPTFSVNVSPKAATASAHAPEHATNVFTVRNTSTAAATFNLQGACTGSQFSDCTVSRPSVTLASGDSTRVGVSYFYQVAPGGELGGGLGGLELGGPPAGVSLRATKSDNAAVTDSGWVTLAEAQGIAAAPPVRLDRDECVVAAAYGGAYECGDLRLTHTLPATRVYNITRAPTLLYNSQHAHPVAVVPVDFVPTRTGPSLYVNQLKADVWYNGAVVATHTWTGLQLWGQMATDVAPQPYRFALSYDASALATGIYDYTVNVTATYSDGQQEQQGPMPGQAVVINRSASPFGAGWWMAGVESLVFTGSGSAPVLWIGGDGSYRVYNPAGTNTWVADAWDRPDTLVYQPDSLQYLRVLPGRTEVRYNTLGQHIRTRGAAGLWTTFNWTGNLLTRIDMPRAQNSAVSYGYDLLYQNPGSKLSQVNAPFGRGVTITMDASRITRILGPDTTSIRLAYAGTSTVPLTRTDRRGAVTTFTFDAGQRLSRATHNLGTAGTTDDVSIGFRAAESQGLAGPVVPGDLYTEIDGPRTDVVDKTRIWVTAAGAPTRVEDALGHATSVLRNDARWPGLVTEVATPYGRTSVEGSRYVTARYDERGNVVSATDWGTLAANGRPAVTSYRWDPRWDKVTEMISPEGLVTRIEYSPVNGLRLSQQPGSDPSRRVEFTYYGSIHDRAPSMLRTVRYPLLPGQTTQAVENYEYDGRGNLSAVVSPLGIRTETIADVMGRDSLDRQQINATATLWQTTEHRLDVMGRDTLTESVGPAMNNQPLQRLTVRTRYDAGGLVTSVQRVTTPDPAQLDSVVTRFGYDGLGRKTTETAGDGKTDVIDYDYAGNVTHTLSRRGLQTWTRYDALNRPDRRIVDGKTYAPQTRTVRMVQDTTILVGSWTFAGVSIPTDTATFTYDVSGNLLAADNHDAQIRRGYTAAGRLQADTLRIRTWAELAAGGSFTAHQYGVGYTYDLDGRRTQLTHPSTVAPQNATTGQTYAQQLYQYDPVFGSLSRVTDVLGLNFDFSYNEWGQVRRIDYPGSNFEQMDYDSDGRVSVRGIQSPGTYKSGSTVIHGITYTYDDLRGKITDVDDNGEAEIASDVTLKYSGLGMLIYNRIKTGAGSGGLPTTEQFTYDALGNRITMLVSPTTTVTAVSRYQKLTGRITTTSPDPTVAYTVGSTTSGEANVSTYDDAGNTEWFQLDQNGGRMYSLTRNSYAADEQLRASERWTCVVENISNTTSICRPAYNLNSGNGGAFEQYRYDALGRRVAVRSVRDPYCGQPSCASTLTRTVWDGDQILYEIRAGAASNDAPSTMENDAAASSILGRVAYTHGMGIDRPLDLIRVGYRLQPGDNVNYDIDRWGGPYAVIPFTNWRGTVDAATTPNGRRVPCQSGTVCPALIRLPGNTYGTWFSPSQPAEHTAWFGSLIEEKLDNTGQMYMRNRYYNPATGRFTQEDPIGLAGGMNAYGFADGDPVSYDDPYGLCKPYPQCIPDEWRAYGRAALHLPRAAWTSFNVWVKMNPETAILMAQTFDEAVETSSSMPGSRGLTVGIPDEALVCRGGTCTGERFVKGKGVTLVRGRLQNVSVNSAPGASLEELTATIPNNQVGVTTAGRVRAAGGNVVPSPTANNPTHATMSGITPADAERLFTPTIRNPHNP